MINEVVNGVVGTGLGMMLGDYNDSRQREQQKKLQDIQIKGQKEMSDYNQGLQYDMWNKTNYGAQKEHMQKAGLNVGLMYGMGGGGGATTGSASGSVGGASAAQGGGAELQTGMQLALMGAQKENIEADTANKKAATANTDVATATNKGTQEATIKKMVMDAESAEEEMYVKHNARTISDHTMQEEIRQIRENTITKILANEGISIENRKKEAELAIKQFEANMAKSGMSPNAPWYIKMMTDIADKHGLNILK